MRDWAVYWRETIPQWNVSEADRNLLATWYTGRRHGIYVKVAKHLRDNPDDFLSLAVFGPDVSDVLDLAFQALSAHGREYVDEIENAHKQSGNELKAKFSSNDLLLDLYYFDMLSASRQYVASTNGSQKLISEMSLAPVYRHIVRKYSEMELRPTLRQIYDANMTFFQELYRRT